MISRRLPETDVAKICVRPKAEQYGLLRGKRSFRPPHSLEPTRNNLASLLGVPVPMFPEETVSREEAITSLMSSIKNEADRKPNLLRARAILDLRDRYIQRAADATMRGHRVTVDNTIYLAHSIILELDNKPVIPFFDLRKSGHLTAKARDFVFSMNYHLLVNSMENFRDFGLVILNYWEEAGQNFGLTPHFFDGRPKYSFEELTDMVATTYSIWLEILDERRNQGEPDEGHGPLFG